MPSAGCSFTCLVTLYLYPVYVDRQWLLSSCRFLSQAPDNNHLLSDLSDRPINGRLLNFWQYLNTFFFGKRVRWWSNGTFLSYRKYFAYLRAVTIVVFFFSAVKIYPRLAFAHSLVNMYLVVSETIFKKY